MIQHNRVMDVKINKLAVGQWCSKTEPYSRGKFQYSPAAKKRHKSSNDDKKKPLLVSISLCKPIAKSKGFVEFHKRIH